MVTGTIAALCGILACHFYCSLRLLRAPLHPDTGQFLYRGFFKARGAEFPLHSHPVGPLVRILKDFFAPGGVDHRYRVDFYSHVPKTRYLPLCQKFGAYQIAEWIGQRITDPKMFRVYLSCYNALSIIAITMLGWTLFSATTGCIAAALFAVYINIPYTDSQQFHAEHLIVLPLVTAIVLVSLGCRHGLPVLLVLGGMAGASLYMLKSSSVIESLFVILSPLFICPQAIAASLIVAAGFAGATLCFFAVLASRRLLSPYLYLALSLSSFIDYKKGVQFSVHKKRFNLMQGGGRDRLAMYLPFLCQMSLLCSGVLLFFALFCHTLYPVFLLLSAWLAWEIVIVVLQGKYYFAHLVSLLPPAVVMAAAAINQTVHTENYIGIGVVVASGVTSFAAAAPYWFSRDSLSYQLRLYASLFHPQTIAFAAAEVIARYVATHSRPDDRVRLWGYNAEFYILSGRRMHQGFDEDYVIGDPPQLESYWGKEWRSWCLRDMALDPPLYIVDMYGTLNIRVVEKATGFFYQVERLFFSLYPVYRRGAFLGRNDTITNDDVLSLDIPPLPSHSGEDRAVRAEIIKKATRLVVQHRIAEADALTCGGITALFSAWRLQNGVHRNDRTRKSSSMGS